MLFTSWHGPCWRDAATAAAAAVRRTVAVLIQHPPWQREREAGTGVVRPAGWLADLRRTTPELDRLGNDKQSQLSSPDPRVLHAYRCRELYERLKVAASSNRRTITAEISADFPRCRSPIMRLLSNGHTVAIAVPAECKLIKIGQVFAPGAARRYAPPPIGVRLAADLRPPAHLWWPASCRQPACLYHRLGQTDRRTDRGIA